MSKATYVIAEAGVNHNGSMDLARALVRAAAEAGADAVKFQTFTAEKLAVAAAPKAEYQKKSTGNEGSQLEMLRKLELKNEDHFELMELAKKCSIEFLSSPFDVESALFLAHEMNLRVLKIPSGEITNAPYLLEVARLGKELIVSTGMCILKEIEEALAVMAFGLVEGQGAKPSPEAFAKAYASVRGQQSLKKNVTLLHCTTEYPAPFASVNLLAMNTLRESFGLPVGYSDHTVGISVPIAATALGATVIEKHFTTDRKLPGPDHSASLEPAELAQMVRSIREVDSALGTTEKSPGAAELKNRAIARKSLMALRPIKKGEAFTAENLGSKRPGSGISPMQFWDYLGKPATKDFAKDELL